MKKILCAITSQQDTDIKTWSILNNENTIISEYQYNVDTDLLLVINGSRNGIYFNFNQGWKYKELAKVIAAHINEDDSIAILFHGADKEDFDKLIDQIENINNNLNIIGIESFSVGADQGFFKHYIEPFIIEKNIDKKKKLFDLLLTKIEKNSPEDKANQAMFLRSQLLTPLVALDWIEQAKEPQYESLKQKAIEEYKRKIDDPDFMQKWDELSLPKPEDYLQSGHDKLNHVELKTFAEAIEAHIEQIQQ